MTDNNRNLARKFRVTINGVEFESEIITADKREEYLELCQHFNRNELVDDWSGYKVEEHEQ